MKYLLMILAVTVQFGAMAQQEVTEQPMSNLEWHTNMMTAVDRAIAADRPLLLFFTGSDWCGWCKRLQAEVFFLPEFEKWANDKVVLLELDFPRRTQLPPELSQQNMNLQQIFQVRGYPTVWFVTPSKQGTEINFEKIGSTGYVRGGPEAWIAEAERILTPQP